MSEVIPTIRRNHPKVTIDDITHFRVAYFSGIQSTAEAFSRVDALAGLPKGDSERRRQMMKWKDASITGRFPDGVFLYAFEAKGRVYQHLVPRPTEQ